MCSAPGSPSAPGDRELSTLPAAAVEAGGRRRQSYPWLRHPPQGGQWRVGGVKGGGCTQYVRALQPALWHLVPRVPHCVQQG